MTHSRANLIPTIQNSVTSRPFHPFEYTEIKPKPNTKQAQKASDKILRNGFRLADDSVDSIAPPMRWDGYKRSFEFHLHAFLPLKRILVAYDRTGDQKYLEASTAYALDWIAQNSGRDTKGSIKSDVAAAFADKHNSRWYDMAVGQRLQVLAYLFDANAHLESTDQDVLAVLAFQIELHHEILSSDKIFKAHNNHGFFQALGQYAAARRLPELDPEHRFVTLARTRLIDMVEKQFTPDRVHIEHSPGYHYMVSVTLINAVRSGVLEDDLAERFKSYEHVLVDMIKPDGHIVSLGDTDPKHLADDGANHNFFTDPELQYILENGALGVMPSPKVKGYFDGGYAFARLHADNVEPTFQNYSYLAQTAAFHSRAHKHADHMSFVWHDRGQDILVDPARYAYAGKSPVGSKLHNQGFWYSDPKRVYVESTRAHNCVEIDGENYARRWSKPFGSALHLAENQSGLAVTDCKIVHSRRIAHRRILIMNPGKFLICLDWLHDRLFGRNYKQWFQFAPHWNVQMSGAEAIATSETDQVGIHNLIQENSIGAIIRGQTEPELQGWVSDAANSLIPSSSISVLAPKAKIGRFATMFSLDQNLIIDPKLTRFNASMRKGQIVYADRDHSRKKLMISLGSPGEVEVSFD